MRHAPWSTTLCALTIATGVMAGCGNPAPKDTQAPTTTDAPTNTDEKVILPTHLDKDSILRFFQNDGTKQLLRDLDNGKVPTSCTVLYDQMGSLPSVTVGDEATIAELVGLVSQIRVLGPSNLGVTDSYHSVSFTLQDGTKVGFNFEGEGNLVTKDQNYFVEGDDVLWSRVRELQGVSERGSSQHAIVVIADKDLVNECPTSANAGDTVRIRTNEVLDVDTVVTVPGADVTQVRGLEHEFVMPDHQVAVYVTTEDYPYGGGS